jgi:predicted O-methyltransferase YrrM
MEADTVLREIEELSRQRFLPIIGPVKGKYLVDTVKKYNVSTVLEVGTLVGYSAIMIAKNLPEGGRVVTIEMDQYSAETARKNMARAGLSDIIDIHIGDAIKVLPGISGEFDMVFLDGTKDEYLQYISLSEGKLKRDGVVFADNVKIFAGAMRDYLDYVRNSGNYRSQYIDAGFDGVEISVKLF